MDVRTRYARVQHITHNRHCQIAEVFFVVANGVHVEQTLRRMSVTTITGVDHMHMRRDMLGDEVRRARLAVAHYKNICRHRAQVGDGVE